MLRSEQETVIRWDRASDEALLYTTHASMASRWGRKGYPVVKDANGWRATVPIRVVSFRMLARPDRQNRIGGEDSRRRIEILRAAREKRAAVRRVENSIGE